MSEYLAYHCTARGARYVDRGKPCEDASLSSSREGIHVAVVADGHGDKSCFRSNIGSEMVCSIALERMNTFAAALRDQDCEEKLFGRDAEKLVTHLFHGIVGQWTERVLQHLADNPPSEEEYASAGTGNAAIYRAGLRLSHIYGTTMIAMLVTDRYALMLHQGDGRCVVFHEDGTVNHPVPWDPRCEGRMTASMCDTDVLEHWRYHIIDLRKDRIIACYAITDGIEDSFETMPEVNAYLCMLTSEYINMGHNDFVGALEAHFSALSRQGSRDDASIGCIIDPDGVMPYIQKYSMLHEYYVAKGEHHRANERLNSMTRKTQYLTEQLEAAKQQVNLTRQSREESIGILEIIRNKLDAAIREKETRNQQYDVAEAALEAAQKEYDEFMAERNQFVEKAEYNRQRMEALIAAIQALPTPEKRPASAPQGEPEDTAPVYVQPEEDYVGFDAESDPVPEPAAEPVSEAASDSDAPLQNPEGTPESLTPAAEQDPEVPQNSTSVD